MSLSICSLSGKLLERPVISLKTGHAYEKALILKHLETTAQCPITGQEMSQDDLIEVNTDNLVVQPRKFKSEQAGAENFDLDTSNILKKIQNEWDTLLLENFQIKKALKETKEEIAHNLYQHEAASLVICRLIKERDEALNQLNIIKSQLEETNKYEQEQLELNEEFDFMGIYDDLVDRINYISQILIAKRRKREISKNLKSIEEIKNFKVKGSYPIHSSSKPGITSIDIHPYYPNLILTGGVDTRAVIFDSEKEATLFATDRGHNKKINQVKFYPSEDILGFCMGSQDNSASFWLKEESGKSSNHNLNFVVRYKTNIHKAPVTSLTFHPLKEYALITSRDSHWSFHSLFKGVCLAKIKTDTENEITKADFHPDGLIFATGENNGLVRIWDISSQNPVLTLECHNTEISGLSFSENGYYLATAAMKDNIVKIVDLRKSEVVRKIELPEKHYEVRSVKFDHSGSYLGIAGSSVHLYGVKSNNLFAQFNEHTDLVTDIAFGQDCHNFATVSLDRNLKIFS